MGTLDLLATLEGHSDPVWHVAWSPRGDVLASCGGDKTIRLWARDASAGEWRCVAVLDGVHSRTVRRVAWSPDGGALASASFDRTVAIWRPGLDADAGGDGDWEDGGDDDAAERGGGSEDERSPGPLGAARSTTAGIRTPSVWEAVAILEGHESEVKDAQWSAGGDRLATCGRDRTVWVWDVGPGDEYDVLDVRHGHSGDVKAVAWAPGPDEMLLSASYDDSVKVWVQDGDEWVCAQTISGGGDVAHTSTVWDLAFSRAGGGEDGAAGGEDPPRAAPAPAPGPAACPPFLATASADGTARTWELTSPAGKQARFRPAQVLRAADEGRAVFSVDWGWASGTQALVTGGADDAIRVFVPRAAARGEGVPSAGEGAVGPSPSLTKLPPAHGTHPLSDLVLAATRPSAHPSDINCVRWHPTESGVLASAGDDGTVRIWLFRAGR